MVTGSVIFILTYLLVSARRLGWLGLDRPAVALIGAVACVLFGVMAPTDALLSVDGNTILLLFGMMGMGAFLAEEGFFERAADHLANKGASPSRLLGWIVWGSGLASAFITNDAVCVIGAPLLCALIRKHRLPPLPYLLALATSANTGSVATLVGNPQNMLCASLGGLEYREHLFLVGPIALVCLAFNHAFLHFVFGKTLEKVVLVSSEKKDFAKLMRPDTWIIMGVITGTAIIFTLGGNLAWGSIGGFGLLFLLQKKRSAVEIWGRIDWSVLVFFAGLFVVVEGFVRTGLPALFFQMLPFDSFQGFIGWGSLSGIFLFGSNIVSNVPFILVVREAMSALPDPKLGWELLTVASTFAGNLTLLGSVANIIVAEKGKEFGGIGFWSHFKIGAPIAFGTTLIGTILLYLFR